MVRLATTGSNQEGETKEPEQLKPEVAFVIYGSKKSNVSCITEHSIDSDSKLSLGNLVSPEVLLDKLASLKVENKKVTHSVFPECLLFENLRFMVWYKKRFIGNQWFRLSDKDKVQSLRVEWTPMVFVADKVNRRISVFSLASNTRPNCDTQLYKAPYMNINGHGGLCLGTANLPKEMSIDTLSLCENTLIDSQFTHSNGSNFQGCNGTDGCFKKWRSFSSKRGKPVRVTAKDLVKYMTFGELLETIVE